MDRHDSTKRARQHLDKAVRANREPLTVEQHIALANAYTELARVEEYHRRTMLAAEAAGITKSQHLKH